MAPAVLEHPGAWPEPRRRFRHERAYALPPLALDDIEAKLTLTVEEVASLLGLGRTAAYEAARRGQIPSRRLGRRVIVPVPRLLDWLGVAAPAA